MPHGMKIGAVSLWLLLLLSEKPMYGYEIIRELEKRFSGYWKPKAGTIYPALEKLEKNRLLTSRVEFREEAPDRKHYALTDAGRSELASTMAYWTRMTEKRTNRYSATKPSFEKMSSQSFSLISRSPFVAGQSMSRSCFLNLKRPRGFLQLNQS